MGEAKPTSMTCLMGEAIKLVKLLMVIPATNASSERAFSTLRYINNYLRTTMFQERLNNLMVYVYKESLDHLDLTSIAQDFVNGGEGRMSLFGSFHYLSNLCFLHEQTPARHSE